MSQFFSIPHLGIMRLPHSHGISLPAYKTVGASGLDLHAAVPEGQHIILSPGQRMRIPTGLIFELPENYEAQIRPRSGLADKYGITCLNTPGTIDSDYRGEIKVLLINLGENDFRIERGMRIAQAIITPVIQAHIEERWSVTKTERDTGSFGSTGTF